MTRTLVLGGTAWLSRTVARTARERGHQVTCLARGKSGAIADGVAWVRSDRSDPTAYDKVRDGDWDQVVDVSREPGHVRTALEALGDRSAHWVFVSSCSVYAAHDTPGVGESAPLLPAHHDDTATVEQYGEAKVACEQLCSNALAERLLIARSGLIGGYGDPSDRFGYWPGRFAAAVTGAGGWSAAAPVLVPDTFDAPTQTLDVGDLAGWLVDAGERGVVGTFNASSFTVPFSDVLDACAEVVSGEVDRTVVPSRWLAEHEVEQYMGPRSLPLWFHDPAYRGWSDRDSSTAYAAGLRARPLAELVAAALEWELEQGLDRERRAGLSPAEEGSLLSEWSAAQPSPSSR